MLKNTDGDRRCTTKEPILKRDDVLVNDFDFAGMYSTAAACIISGDTKIL